MPLLPTGGKLHGNSGQFVVTLAFHFVLPPVLRAQGCVEHILLRGDGGGGCSAGQRFMLRGERI